MLIGVARAQGLASEIGLPSGLAQDSKASRLLTSFPTVVHSLFYVIRLVDILKLGQLNKPSDCLELTGQEDYEELSTEAQKDSASNSSTNHVSELRTQLRSLSRIPNCGAF
jgi:hypothetical protein